ncbi:hypothetical protein EYW44_21120 [Tenacibaculum sp. M341]|nr:hypothetical protein EYW44_21120 [Tenacibaculum sp. M341]
MFSILVIVVANISTEAFLVGAT